jgi:RIO-like serine/threonine protein kinase
MRNLRRIYAAGIPCPQPVLINNNVLVMEFLGKEGWPSPRYVPPQGIFGHIPPTVNSCAHLGEQAA